MRHLSCTAYLIALGLMMPVGGRARQNESETATRARIHEAMFVPLGGMEQWITIRGDDVRNPVILMLHGGPGFPTSELAPAFAPLESRYTLVQWDQPGGGATYAKNLGKDAGPLTIARYCRDGIELTEFLERHLHAGKIILYGTSWGTILAFEMAQSRPELFSGYVGISQVAGPRGNRLGYELAFRAAEDRGDRQAVADLRRVGPPPYHSFEDYMVRQKYTNPPGLPPTPREMAGYAALAKLLAVPPAPRADYIAHGLPAYDGPKVFLDTNRAVFKEEEAWDPYKHRLAFRMPILILNGDHDFNTPARTAMMLCHAISAPHKHCEVIPGYGHGTIPIETVLDRMTTYIRPFVSERPKPSRWRWRSPRQKNRSAAAGSRAQSPKSAGRHRCAHS